MPRLMPFLFKLWRWLPIPFWAEWRLLWVILPKFLVGAIAVIVNAQGQVLLFYHTYRKQRPWSLPGGWLQTGEDASHAIVRELQEEAGLTIIVQQPLMIATSPLYPRIDVFFVCRHVAGEFRASPEVAEARFFEVETLESVLEPGMYPMLIDALTRVGLQK
jgi:8-oxo-dGTP diphosphatase